MTCCKCYLVIGSEREDRLNSSVCVCVRPSPDNTQTFTPYKIKSSLKRYLFIFYGFFCTYICIKLHFTCVCLLAPSRSLLKRTTGVESVVFYPRAPWGNLGLKMFLSIWKRRGAVDQSWRWPNTLVSTAVKLCYCTVKPLKHSKNILSPWQKHKVSKNRAEWQKSRDFARLVNMHSE